MALDRSLVRRTLTIFVVAPTILYGLLSSSLVMALFAWGLTFVAMLEWTALKRHLKVVLLSALSSAAGTSSSSLTSPGATPPHKKKDGGGSPELTCPAIPDGLPQLEDEYALPVAKTNAFIVCKCLASSLVACAAAGGPDLFHFGMKLYFLFWVFFTLMGQNRAETTAVAARRKVRTASIDRGAAAQDNNNVNTGGTTGNRSSRSATREERSNNNVVMSASDAFQIRELAVIAELFTSDIFLSFSLEYFGFVWATGLSYAMLLYRVPNCGVLLVANVLVSNWANDIAALIVGRSLKGHTRPLYPRLSPNKSLEGAVAGVIANGACAAGIIYFFGGGIDFGTDSPVLVFFLLGIVFGVLGVMGDLLQSLFKRSARLKDTGAFFPGHGGVLDRIDGLLIVYPAAYWLIWLMMSLNIMPSA